MQEVDAISIRKLVSIIIFYRQITDDQKMYYAFFYKKRPKRTKDLMIPKTVSS